MLTGTLPLAPVQVQMGSSGVMVSLLARSPLLLGLPPKASISLMDSAAEGKVSAKVIAWCQYCYYYCVSATWLTEANAAATALVV